MCKNIFLINKYIYFKFVFMCVFICNNISRDRMFIG